MLELDCILKRLNIPEIPTLLSEEVDKVVKIVRTSYNWQCRIHNENGKEAILTASEIKIITPYNAQVQAIKQQLTEYRGWYR